MPQKNVTHQMAAACEVKNKEVLEMAGADPISEEVRRRRWCWIGHVLRQEVNKDCAVALGWKPELRRNRNRPKTTWRRTVEKESDRQGWNTWTRARQAANNRQQWRKDVQALCASWGEEIKLMLSFTQKCINCVIAYIFIFIYEICIHVLETHYEKYFILHVALLC